MQKFTKSETLSILIIFSILFLIVGINLSASLRKGRDATRKNDMSVVQKALDKYHQKYHTYPLSTTDGKIIGCFNGDPITDQKTGVPLNAVVCEYGKSTFETIKTMVNDPSSAKGYSYLYISDGNYYQFYVSLEGKKEAEYTIETANQNLHCGNQICNYGRSN